jgi:parvulin-like peptidyl-prolyl isomerase
MKRIASVFSAACCGGSERIMRRTIPYVKIPCGPAAGFFESARCFACVFLPLFVMISAMLVPAPSHGRVIERILATVGDEAVTFADYRLFVKANGDAAPREEVDKALLGKMIEEKIILLEAKRQGMDASEAEISKAIEELTQQYRLSPEDFEKMLREEGMSLDVYKKGTKERIMVSKMIDREVDSKVFLRDQEIEEYYRAHQKEFPGSPEAVELKAVFLRLREDASLTEITDLKLKALRIAALLREGDNFDRVLYEYSDEPLKSNEGILGEFAKGSLVPPVDTMVFALKEGEISDPVWVSEGAYILQLVRRISERYKTIDEVKEEIRRALYERKREKLFNEWLKTLWEKSSVTINEN